jgi:DNA-binding response OmpR family regulator
MGAGELEGGGKAPGRVLIVEDDDDVAESLCMLLELDGYATERAHNGATAVLAARSFSPQVVLLDLGLPDMDGYAVLERLTPLAETRGATFIALSGRAEPEDLERSQRSGFHHHMVKPPDLDELRARLSAAT